MNVTLPLRSAVGVTRVRRALALLVPAALLALPLGAAAQDGQTTVTLASWRSEDATQWNEVIIPAFEAAHPDINIEFVPVRPQDYASIVGSQLQAGTAADLVAAIPFDQSLQWYQAGFLEDLTGLPGLENFTPVAKSGWSTDDGSAIFAVPMASVIQGFFYNKDAFAELGLEVPTTEEEFFAVLEAIKASGKYIPLAFGTGDEFLNGPSLYDNFGPNYYGGEDGRQAIIQGTAKLTDDQYVEPLRVIERLVPYMPDDAAAIRYADTQALFQLGRAAIFPGGSWEITGFEANAPFEIGVFPPFRPTADAPLHITDHIDIGTALNANAKNPEAAKVFLEWLTTAEFAQLFTNSVPGFFALNTTPVTVEDPLAAGFVGWREDAASTTIRIFYQYLTRGVPNLVNEENTVIAGIINGTTTPDDAAAKLQAALDAWYTPGAPPPVPSFAAES